VVTLIPLNEGFKICGATSCVCNFFRPAKETEPRKEVDAFFTQQRAHKQGIDFSNDRKSFEENGSVSANE